MTQKEATNEKYIRIFYIPPFLSRMWMQRDRTFRIYRRVKRDFMSLTTQEIFRERVLVNTCDISFLELSCFFEPAFTDIFTRLQSGDASLMDLDFYHISYLIKVLSSYTNIRKEYRSYGIHRLYEREKSGKTDPLEYDTVPIVTSELKSMLRYASLFFYPTADLRGRLLKAPDNRAFILGDNPVVLFNPLLSEEDPATASDFTANGACVVLPISPSYALFLYDESIYSVPQENVTELTEDDWFRINIAQYAQSHLILYKSEDLIPFLQANAYLQIPEYLIKVSPEDVDPDFPPEILSRLSLSFLDLRRDVYFRIEAGEDYAEYPRPFIRKMEQYDIKMMEESMGEDDIDILTGKLRERKKYVTSLCLERSKINGNGE